MQFSETISWVKITLNVDKNVLSYTEDDLKESRNVCKYR